MIKYLIVQAWIGALAAIITLIVYHKKKPSLCDSCKHLVQKGGGAYKYYCEGGRYSYSIDYFDKPPKYCAYHEPRIKEEN